jgi:hypothetical protein
MSVPVEVQIPPVGPDGILIKLVPKVGASAFDLVELAPITEKTDDTSQTNRTYYDSEKQCRIFVDVTGKKYKLAGFKGIQQVYIYNKNSKRGVTVDTAMRKPEGYEAINQANVYMLKSDLEEIPVDQSGGRRSKRSKPKPKSRKMYKKNTKRSASRRYKNRK